MSMYWWSTKVNWPWCRIMKAALPTAWPVWPVPTVVVTLGHRGSCARHNGAFALQSAFPISPVDTTGAGDTFCGSLVAALSQGQPLAGALRFASAASAIACTRWGAESSIPETTEVEALLCIYAPDQRRRGTRIAHLLRTELISLTFLLFVKSHLHEHQFLRIRSPQSHL